MEDNALRQLMTKLNRALLPANRRESGSRFSQNPLFFLRYDDPLVAERCREIIGSASKQLPKVVKQPQFTRFLTLWMGSGGPTPEFVVVCTRNTLDQAIANARDGAASGNVSYNRQDALTEYGMLLETLLTYEIPFCFVRFPKSVTDPNETYHKIPFFRSVPEDRFHKAWEKVVNLPGVLTTEREEVRRRVLEED